MTSEEIVRELKMIVASMDEEIKHLNSIKERLKYQ
jgi:hypothetical protein